MKVKSFAETFEDACNRLGGDHMRMETDRVHRDATRDKQHSNSKVNIKGPEPWKRTWTGPTLML